MARDMRSDLWLRGNGMKDVNATDSPTLNEGAKSADDSFDFREFRHGRCTGSRCRLEGERVLSSFSFGGIAERRENGFAFVPVGKLIGVVAAAGLAGLSRGDEQNGFIPVGGIGHESHCRALVLQSRSHHAAFSSRLRRLRNTP